MSSIESLLEQARENYHRASLYHHFNGDRDRVARAQVALDYAEDTMDALLHYEREGIGSDSGEKYLRLFGFLQAAFVQQDAIWELHRLFVGECAEPSDKTAWRRLRELRNLTVGHPIEMGPKNKPRKRTFITQISLGTDGFDYQVWHQDTTDYSFERADLLATYDAYKQEASTILDRVLIKLSNAPDYCP